MHKWVVNARKMKQVDMTFMEYYLPMEFDRFTFQHRLTDTITKVSFPFFYVDIRLTIICSQSYTVMAYNIKYNTENRSYQ